MLMNSKGSDESEHAHSLVKAITAHVHKEGTVMKTQTKI